MLLVGILHLYDKLLTAFILAVHIKYGLTLRIHITYMLTVQKLHVGYHLVAFKQAVQEIDQQVLVGLRAKDAFETKVGQQADVAFF